VNEKPKVIIGNFHSPRRRIRERSYWIEYVYLLFYALVPSINW